MAASATQNPAVKLESKSAKKKKAKAEASAESAAVSAPEVAQSNNPSDNNNDDGTYESPYIKELHKSIRNVNKKITNASKVDNVLAENPGKTLDELVASRKINNDQKAQILKKPALQASLTQLEEQIAQYTKFDQEYKTKAQADKSALEKTFTERASKELEEAVASVKSEARDSAVKDQKQSLLIVSQFLRLAAVRRGEEEQAESDENQALESLLGAVYAGTNAAVNSMVNLIEGSEEPITLVDGQASSITYAHLKKLAQDQDPVPEDLEVPDVEPVEEDSDDTPTVKSDVEEFPVQSDPTIAHAGLTEIDAESATTALPNGHESTEIPGVPQNSGFGDEGNAAAEANWDGANDLSTSQEWVEIPRDAAETETGLAATPAAPSNTQSWADDQPDSPNEKSTAPADDNDGFHAVSRNRTPRPQGQGQGYRGRGGRGGGEGRGRGNYRGGEGRGRGGRGGRGGGRGRGGRPENDS